MLLEQDVSTLINHYGFGEKLRRVPKESQAKSSFVLLNSVTKSQVLNY